MEFRTTLTIPPSSVPLSLQSTLLTIGSCFADAMGTRMEQNKFKVLANPYGTVFNPISVAKLLRIASGLDQLNENRFVQLQEYWYHYDFHSRFHSLSIEDLSDSLKKTIHETATFLAQTDCLILTLGTSIVYQLTMDSQIVNNCHKVTEKGIFEKRMLTEPEIFSQLETVFTYLWQHNPKLHIILTISPVRHIKDTIQLNSVSKSLLRLVCYHLTERFSAISYFPAYEIMMDDLRDYRFYKADMIHPSEVAEDYIWQLFIKTYLDKEAQLFLQEWSKIRQALSHHPFREQSDAYRQFLNTTEQKILSWQHYVDVSIELSDIRNRIARLNI